MSIDGRTVIDTPKSHQQRVVTIDDATADALRTHHQQRKAGYFAAGVRPDRVLVHADGRTVSPGHVSRTFRRDTEAACVPRIRFHDLRHTHATLGLRDGVALKVMSERLGHRDISITANIYSHVDKDLQVDTAAKFGALVHG